MSTTKTRYMRVEFMIGSVPLSRTTDIEDKDARKAICDELDKIEKQHSQSQPRIVSIHFFEKEEGGACDYIGDKGPWHG